jgi:hypothetical protein
MNSTDVLGFATQLGLSTSNLSQLSAAVASVNILSSVGLLTLSLLYPHLTFWPGDPDYVAIQQENW